MVFIIIMMKLIACFGLILIGATVSTSMSVPAQILAIMSGICFFTAVCGDTFTRWINEE